MKHGKWVIRQIGGDYILEVEGEEITLDKNHLVMVEPGEKHFVKKVIKLPFSCLSICTVKKRGDKVVV